MFRHLRRWILLTLAGCISTWTAASQAGVLGGPAQSSSVIHKAPQQAVVQKPYLWADGIQKLGVVQKGAASACGCPGYGCIRYRNHPLLRKPCCRTCAPIQTVLVVQDPRYCCCGTEIPVCISACCSGAPQVSSRVGLLGCGYVTYRWCCGYTIKIVFRGNGDIIVHTYGL